MKMSDTNAATVSPAASSEVLSEAEMAYFKSGGTDTSGLQIENAPTAPPATAPGDTQEAAPTDQAKAPAGEEGDEDGIVIGPDGRARNAKSGQYVPHAALHKERTRRKEIEAENLSYRDKLARVEERLAIFNEMLGKGEGTGAANAPTASKEAGKSALEEEPIDPDVDIFAALRQQQRINAELRRMVTEGEKAREQQNAATSIKTAYQQDATAFMAKAPDFKDAYEHLVATLHKELEMMGVADEAARNRAIAEQERELVANALKQNKSPAELIYGIAKTRGFYGSSPKVIPQQNATQRQASPEAKIDNVLRGQGAVLSLSKAGGASGEGLTVEALASMSEAEFAAMTKSLSKAQLRAIMGG